MKRNLGMTLPFLRQKVKEKKCNPITFIRTSEPVRYKSHANPSYSPANSGELWKAACYYTVRIKRRRISHPVRHPTLWALHTRAKHLARPPPASASLDGQPESFLKLDFPFHFTAPMCLTPFPYCYTLSDVKCCKIESLILDVDFPYVAHDDLNHNTRHELLLKCQRLHHPSCSEWKIH